MTRIVIDYSLCSGNGRCYALYPDLFSDDEGGYGRVVGQGVVAADRREDAELVVRCCPEHAIAVEDNGADDTAPSMSN